MRHLIFGSFLYQIMRYRKKNGKKSNSQDKMFTVIESWIYLRYMCIWNLKYGRCMYFPPPPEYRYFAIFNHALQSFNQIIINFPRNWPLSPESTCILMMVIFAYQYAATKIQMKSRKKQKPFWKSWNLDYSDLNIHSTTCLNLMKCSIFCCCPFQ